MSIMEILFLVIGAVIFAAGFIVPEKIGGKFTDPGVARAQNEIRKAADDSVENAKQRISDIVNTQSGVAQDETERAMDRITNDKIMAINVNINIISGCDNRPLNVAVISELLRPESLPDNSRNA